MRNTFLMTFLVTAISVSSALAQDYNITFAILGSSEKPATVLVENTTQSTQKTLVGSDILNLVAEIVSGIENINTDVDKTLQVYPNPVKETAIVAFSNPSAGKVNVNVVNAAGTKVASISSELPQGEVNYTLSGLSTGNYVVHVQSADYRASCIILSQIESSSKPSITLSSSKKEQTKSNLKSTSETVKMQYNAGDVLKFTATLNTKNAYVDNYTATQNDAIEFSFTYTITYYNVGTKNAAENPATYTAENVITLAAATDSTGYNFAGWFTDAAFTDTVSTPTIAQGSTGDTAFYAKWIATPYNITYYNVGTKNAAANPATYTIEEAITLAAATDSATYVFAGWFTDAAFTDTVSTPTIAQGSTGDAAFYAKWIAIPPIIDVEGNTYQVVKIGEQYWMAENLRTTKFADGTPILNVDDRTQNGAGANNAAWAALGDNDTDKAYCWHLNDSITYSQTYGAIYTYAAASDGNTSGSNVQGVCPTGWHLPSDAEWITLEDFITNDGHSEKVGTALKATSGWLSYGNGTDDYGFAALPGGQRGAGDGVFSLTEKAGFFWSSAQYSSVQSKQICLTRDISRMVYRQVSKSIGISVRCIRD